MTHGLSSVKKPCSSFDSLKKGKNGKAAVNFHAQEALEGSKKNNGKMKTTQIGMKNDWSIS